MEKRKSDTGLLQDAIYHIKAEQALGEAIRHLCGRCYPGSHGGVSIKGIEQLGILAENYAYAAEETLNELLDRKIKEIRKEQQESSATETASKRGPKKIKETQA